MGKLKVSEIFYSLQGEGLFMGTPSIFLRLFGCNFTCGGFGLSRGEISQERFKVDPKQFKKYEDLPLVHTGCDSYPSWDPRFKHLSPVLEVDEVVDKIISLLPERKFDVNKHFIITGGEPLLPGWQNVIPELLQKLYDKAYLSHVTFETNGTQSLTPTLCEYLVMSELDVTFSVSSKLPVSGHSFDEAIKPDVLNDYYWTGTRTYLKWVVANEQDIEDVNHAIQLYSDGMKFMDDIPIYLMPVGGTTKGYYLNNKRVAEIAMKNGWRYSPRLQIELWKNSWAT